MKWCLDCTRHVVVFRLECLVRIACGQGKKCCDVVRVIGGNIVLRKYC